MAKTNMLFSMHIIVVYVFKYDE